MFGDGFCVSKNYDKGLEIYLDKPKKVCYSNHDTKLMLNYKRKEDLYLQAPQVFHDKPETSKNFVAYPVELFAAINQTCNGNEAKILLTLLGCKGDGSFSPSTAYMMRMAGITQPNNYYKIRKSLENKGFIRTDEKGNLYISIQRILGEAKLNEQKRKEEAKTQHQPPSEA